MSLKKDTTEVSPYKSSGWLFYCFCSLFKLLSDWPLKPACALFGLLPPLVCRVSCFGQKPQLCGGAHSLANRRPQMNPLHLQPKMIRWTVLCKDLFLPKTRELLPVTNTDLNEPLWSRLVWESFICSYRYISSLLWGLCSLVVAHHGLDGLDWPTEGVLWALFNFRNMGIQVFDCFSPALPLIDTPPLNVPCLLASAIFLIGC